MYLLIPRVILVYWIVMKEIIKPHVKFGNDFSIMMMY